MSMRCNYCGKGKQRGHSVSHAKNRHLRRFKPNLHRRRVVEQGEIVRRLLCMKCLKKAEKVGQKVSVKKVSGKTMQPLAFTPSSTERYTGFATV